MDSTIRVTRGRHTEALSPEQFAAQKRRERLHAKAHALHKVIVERPGLPCLADAEVLAGLDIGEAGELVAEINHPDSSFTGIAYGPVDGQWGWYAENRARHASAFDWRDRHKAAVERGIRDSRRLDLQKVGAHRGQAWQALAREIAARLEIDARQMTLEDAEVIEALVAEAENGAAH